MPRPYNPNTKYGRKKAREEFQKRYENEMTPEERESHDSSSAFLYLIIIVIVLGIIYATSGSHGVTKYISR